MLFLLITGCNPELDDKTTLTFIGDSIIARWDLQSSFSSLITYNKGVSGSGISYIEELSGKLSGRNIVILSGTNDNHLMKDQDSRKSYALRYIDAINSLKAEKIYLYEVLPREFKDENFIINENIRLFNNEINELISNNERIVYLKVFDNFLNDSGHINWQFYYDGLHLNSEGYNILANALFCNL